LDRGGQFTSNLRPRWTDPVTARRVQSKWKGVERGARGDKGEISKGREKARGEKKQGECTMYVVTCIRVYKRMLETFEWFQLCI
jgi:hypothetical protein